MILRQLYGKIMNRGSNSPRQARSASRISDFQRHPSRTFRNSDRNRSGDRDSKHDKESQKRRGSSLDSPPGKRPRTGGHHSKTPVHQSSSSSSITDNYIVPVSHGTEKITMAIWNYFINHQMTDEDLTKKLQLRKNLLSILTGSFPNCRLFIVGSSMTGFATRTSDVDMCLMITQDEMNQKRDATLILTLIARALRQCSFVRQAQVIRAKVPILKFYDSVSGVECDLNINNIIGVRNTHLLRHYAYMDWRVRPLMLFIKKWARFHDINDASKKTISSYSLSLMLIHYLQVGVNPPVLPCLQQLQPDIFSPKHDVRKLSLSMADKLDFTSGNQATLGELFLDFLKYYTFVFSFDKNVISIRKGRCISRSDVRGNEDNMWKFLNIEEPFEGNNTARSVYDFHVFTRILRVFKASHSFLDKSRDIDSVMSRPF